MLERASITHVAAPCVGAHRNVGSVSGVATGSQFRKYYYLADTTAAAVVAPMLRTAGDSMRAIPIGKRTGERRPYVVWQIPHLSELIVPLCLYGSIFQI